MFGACIPVLNLFRRRVTSKKANKGSSLIENKEKVPNKADVRLKLTLITLVQALFGVLFMLLLMTYNGWVILSVCFGMSLGYFLFESRFDTASKQTSILQS
jgi:Ctr copper transporter family.